MCRVYEAAAAAVGADYTSGLLWDKYLAYEATLGSPSAVAALYSRVLACPVKDLDKYHTG
jgi:pre-mRNA-processing factor 39